MSALTPTTDRAAESSPWSSRETALLEAALRLLRQHGYDTATVYRRWPSTAELISTAFMAGARQVAVVPDTGTLRGEIDRDAIGDDLWDPPPGYRIFRSIMASRPPTQPAVLAVVDDAFVRGLTGFTSRRKANV